MRNAPKVPELRVDEAAIGMDSPCNLFPACNLLGIPDTGGSLPFGTTKRR